MPDEDWRLRPAKVADFATLSGWFPDAESVTLWGGPKFRYPFTDRTFREDCRWPAVPSYMLCNPHGLVSGFGQYYARQGRVHLARLVIRPGLRGQGIGQRLVRLLIQAGSRSLGTSEASLFVFRHNLPALRCYRSLGFEIADYPPDQELADEVFLLTRPPDS